MLLPAQAPDGSGSLLGCVVEARVVSSSRWSVMGQVLRVLYRPPPVAAVGAGSSSTTTATGAICCQEAQGGSCACEEGSVLGGGGDGGVQPECTSSGCGQQGEAAAVTPAAAATFSVRDELASESAAASERQLQQQQQGVRFSLSPMNSSRRGSSGNGDVASSPASAESGGGGDGRGLEAEASVASVMSDGIFPLARAGPSADHAHMAAAEGAEGVTSAGRRRPASDGSGSGATQALLLLGLLVGLTGMLISGLLSLSRGSV